MRRWLWAALVAAACGSEEAKTIPYERLAEYGLFVGDGSTQEPAAGVVPYEVIAPLFSDFTEKYRFIALPEGGQIGYRDDAPWDFPVGTILVKTFAYPFDLRAPEMGRRLLETRLIIRGEDGAWTPHTYVWNEAQTQAKRQVAGARLAVTWIDRDGVTRNVEYRVPNTNQCQGCHGLRPNTRLLGPRSRQLNRDHDYGAGPVNQIDHMQALGLFAATPPPPAERPRITDFMDASQPIEARARSYLEANCAHCHNEGAPAESSGLELTLETTNPRDLGVCRPPFSAGHGSCGREWDIVPGEPDASIMVCRMESTDPEIKMPEMPTQFADPDGVAIVREWIASMPATGCGQ